MFRRMLGPGKFRIIVIGGLSVQFLSMLCAVAIEGTLVSALGSIATIAISVWLEDAEAAKSTYKNNMNCVIMILVAIIAMCAFINAQQITPIVMVQLITEVVFMFTIITDTQFLP